MSRAVRPRDVPSALALAIGACWTTVLVPSLPTTSKPTRRRATTAPPTRAETKPRSEARLAWDIGSGGGGARSSQNKNCRRLLGHPGELPAGGLDVLRTHQGLAHQPRVHSHPVELVQLVAGRVAGLRDHGLARRHVRQQLERGLEGNMQVGEVSVVYAAAVDVDSERLVEIAFVVHLDEHVEVQGASLEVEAL